MILKHNHTISLLGMEKAISFESLKTLKPMVSEAENILKVFTSELKKITHEEVLESWMRDRFKLHAEDRVLHFASLHGFEYNRVVVKKHRSRWGSCSSKKNLNFNWRLIFTPLECIDYVIVHELAHTKQMNHSRNFWAIVEEIVPDYKIHRKTLREFERLL